MGALGGQPGQPPHTADTAAGAGGASGHHLAVGAEPVADHVRHGDRDSPTHCRHDGAGAGQRRIKRFRARHSGHARWRGPQVHRRTGERRPYGAKQCAVVQHAVAARNARRRQRPCWQNAPGRKKSRRRASQNPTNATQGRTTQTGTGTKSHSKACKSSRPPCRRSCVADATAPTRGAGTRIRAAGHHSATTTHPARGHAAGATPARPTSGGRRHTADSRPGGRRTA